MTAVRRTQLARLGVWIGLATAAVLTAVLAARTETGIRRITNLLTPAASEPVRTAKAPAAQPASRQADQEAEQRRLSEAIRVLAADRDRLLARIGALERNLDDVTGSIAPVNASPPSPSPLPPIASTPAPATTAPPPATAARPAQPNGVTIQSRVAAGHLATGNPGPAESTQTKTEFGLDIGGNTSIEGLRTLWTTLKASQPALLDGLRPIIAVREGPKPGSIELRLVAGPLANASIAARICAALTSAGQSCQPALFDGQRLALQ